MCAYIYDRLLTACVCALPETVSTGYLQRDVRVWVLFVYDIYSELTVSEKKVHQIRNARICTFKRTSQREQSPISRERSYGRDKIAAVVAPVSRVNDINLFQGRFQKRILCKGQTMTYTN